MMGFMMLKKSCPYLIWLWKYLHLEFAEVTKNHLVKFSKFISFCHNITFYNCSFCLVSWCIFQVNVQWTFFVRQISRWPYNSVATWRIQRYQYQKNISNIKRNFDMVFRLDNISEFDFVHWLWRFKNSKENGGLLRAFCLYFSSQNASVVLSDKRVDIIFALFTVHSCNLIVFQSEIKIEIHPLWAKIIIINVEKTEIMLYSVPVLQKSPIVIRPKSLNFNTGV